MNSEQFQEDIQKNGNTYHKDYDKVESQTFLQARRQSRNRPIFSQHSELYGFPI